MPQIFQVLRCYKCSTFQVHQTKKSNKFACKVCNEKQSIKRHYGIGMAKDCRMHVQKLNKMRGEKDETKIEDVSDEDEEANISNTEATLDTTNNLKKTSKWLSYIDEQIEEVNDESQFILETNHKNNKRQGLKSTSSSYQPWSRINKYQNYKEKKNFVSWQRKHCNDIAENEANDVIENSISQVKNNNAKNVFGKRPLFENGDDCRGNKVNRPSHHDIKLPKNNSEFKINLKNFTNINKSPKLDTPEVKKSSKWAQFIVRDETISEENCDDEVEIVPKNIQPLFSLCDESDIDDLLDI